MSRRRLRGAEKSCAAARKGVSLGQLLGSSAAAVSKQPHCTSLEENILLAVCCCLKVLSRDHAFFVLTMLVRSCC